MAANLDIMREQVRAKAQARLDMLRSQRRLKEEFEANQGDKAWRLRNLYKFVDYLQQERIFDPNWAQSELAEAMDEHPKWIVLKARQLGLSTYIRLDDLDSALFEPNTQVGLIADTLENAVNLLRNKDKFALENMDDWVKPYLPKIIKINETEIRFDNGSFIVAGVSLRSGTYGRLHISELGKISSQFPLKAAEIKSGALNTVARNPSAVVRIESTAAGSTGMFYDMSMEALNRPDDAIVSPLQYKLKFFPWWGEHSYEIPPGATDISSEDKRYFERIDKEDGIKLNDRQKAWYVDKKKEQGDKLLQEFPSTEQEAFQGTSEGQYYSKHILAAEREERITNIKPHPERPVYTFFDLGVNDATVIVFMQFGENEQRYIFDCYANTGYGFGHYVGVLKDKQSEHGFHQYGMHVFPHDAGKRQMGKDDDPTTIADDFRELGLIDLEVMRRGDLVVGINQVRRLLPFCWFDKSNCATLINALRSYRRVWNEGLRAWGEKPLHDWSSDYCDAVRTMVGFEPQSKKLMEYSEEDFHPPNLV